MKKTWLCYVSIVGVSAMLAACGGGSKEPASAPAKPAAAPAAPAAAADEGTDEGGGASDYTVAEVTDGGSVAGKVTFSGTHEPEPIEATKDTQACGTEKPDQTVLTGEGGSLKNVVVWIDGIKSGKDWAGDASSVDQKECVYTPHVQAVPAAQSVDIMNSDPVLHNVHAYYNGETLFNIAQPTQGQTSKKKFSKTGVVELKCDVHSWMHAYIFVAPNPYYAVTGDDGMFSLGDVPAGTYKVKAWHEKLGEKEMEVTVAAGAAAEAQFAFGG